LKLNLLRHNRTPKAVRIIRIFASWIVLLV
jgi:hypothetical protein